MFIEPGGPWENGYCESFNSIKRDNFLNGELFDMMLEAKVLTERWRHHYNTVRPQAPWAEGRLRRRLSLLLEIV